jgi:hypothetical protein
MSKEQVHIEYRSIDIYGENCIVALLEVMSSHVDTHVHILAAFLIDGERSMSDGRLLQSSNYRTVPSRLNFCNASPVGTLTVVLPILFVLESEAFKRILPLTILTFFVQHNISKRRAACPEARSFEVSEYELHRVAAMADDYILALELASSEQSNQG